MKKWIMTGWVAMVLSILLAVNVSFARQRSERLPAWRYYDGGYFKKDADRRPYTGERRHLRSRDMREYNNQKWADERRRYSRYHTRKKGFDRYEGSENPYGRHDRKPQYGRRNHDEKRLPGDGYPRTPGTYHLGGAVVRQNWSFGFSLGIPSSRSGRYGHR